MPDLGDELLVELARVEELLLTLAVLEENDPGGSVVLSGPLTGRLGLDALNRLQQEIGPTQSHSHPCGRALPLLFGADGHRECRPLRRVELAIEDLAVLSATAMCLGHALAVSPGGELAEAIAAGAEAGGGGPLPPVRPALDVVAAFARVIGLLDLACTEDTELLGTRLRDARGDVVLTAGEEDAYDRVADRMKTMWAGGSPRERWQY